MGVIQAPWRVLARADVTRRLAHGDRYLQTRLYLADGRVMEQVNVGVPDLENEWREVARFTDLRSALDDLRRQGGWDIRVEDRFSTWPALAGLGAASLTLALTTAVLVELSHAGVIQFRSAPGFTVAYVPTLALGIVVARALGGWPSTLGVLLFGVAASTRLIDFIDLETLFAYSAIPAGVLLGVIGAELVGRRHIPLRAPLEAAGAFGMTSIALFLLDAAARRYTSPETFGYPATALGLAAAVAAGVVIARRSERPRHDALLLTAVLVAIELARLPTILAALSGDSNAVVTPVRAIHPLLVLGTAAMATRDCATRGPNRHAEGR